jgi:hypothetical protein
VGTRNCKCFLKLKEQTQGSQLTSWGIENLAHIIRTIYATGKKRMLGCSPLLVKIYTVACNL